MNAEALRVSKPLYGSKGRSSEKDYLKKKSDSTGNGVEG